MSQKFVFCCCWQTQTHFYVIENRSPLFINFVGKLYTVQGKTPGGCKFQYKFILLNALLNNRTMCDSHYLLLLQTIVLYVCGHILYFIKTKSRRYIGVKTRLLLHEQSTCHVLSLCLLEKLELLCCNSTHLLCTCIQF